MSARIKGWMGAAAALGAASGALMSAAPAEACGGFFCSRVPVDQTGENILFVQEGDEIEAHVNILYQGEAEDFAWIVPTPSRPEINISSQDVFARLDQTTGVRYSLNFLDAECFVVPIDDAGMPEADPGNDGEVTVVQQSSVGPYDFAVLQATSTEALFGWLGENNYDIPSNVMPFVEPYVTMGPEMHFVAFRLQSDREVGDIAPVRMRYRASAPMVPIQLTAIASQPDMGVRVHVLAEARAVPANYLHVHVNEARIDWLNSGSNYNQLVTEAMNEAGGQGFTTEYAGPSSVMAEVLFREGQYDTARLAGLRDPVAFMEELMRQGFLGNNQLLAMLRRYLPLPAQLQGEVDERDFYNCVSCYAEFIDAEGFDAAAFANELESAIVEPLRHAQSQFDAAPYLSRLFTTLSAEEMTRDPGFAYNPNMADVSNVRTADADANCDPNNPREMTVTITLSDGRILTQFWDNGVYVDDSTEPAADLIEQTGGEGPATVVRDINSGVDILDEVLDARDNAEEPRDIPSGGTLDPTIGCATAPGNPAPIPLLLLAIGLFALRRRSSSSMTPHS